MPQDTPSTGTPIHEIKAELFKGLAHPARVRVLELLVDGESPVSSLLAATGMESSHLSQHLAVLRRAALVTARREGSAVHYRISDPAVVDLLDAARTFLVSRLSETRAALGDLEQQAARGPAAGRRGGDA